MIKGILDELILKNSENLSQHNFQTNSSLRINKDVDKLKINDDTSNEDIILMNTHQKLQILM
ncbi:hypothetical protein A500_16695 [Clostridium sartagoforme AAU1]|uniref:Uncharacterized protein n=1 Tax=Clostridium sartagoforme AAU1 TaxID=1202534 RepID=R9BUX6_9CLOT|nr:hypothetical protein [Clostridium sartagoforme]EOR20515.1 hypothetical protein A500_16695 [Clostridium sartagoforme AAU1]